MSYSCRIIFCVHVAHLHLLMPTFVLPANHGSKTNTQRKVEAPTRPSLNEGLSCSLRPLRNQWTVCFPPSPCSLTSGFISLLRLPVIFPPSSLPFKIPPFSSRIFRLFSLSLSPTVHTLLFQYNTNVRSDEQHILEPPDNFSSDLRFSPRAFFAVSYTRARTHARARVSTLIRIQAQKRTFLDASLFPSPVFFFSSLTSLSQPPPSVSLSFSFSFSFSLSLREGEIYIGGCFVNFVCASLLLILYNDAW